MQIVSTLKATVLICSLFDDPRVQNVRPMTFEVRRKCWYYQPEEDSLKYGYNQDKNEGARASERA